MELSTCAILVPGLLTALVSTSNGAKPNVAIFLADNLGWSDPGFLGSKIDTPSLDPVARDEMPFNRFYATSIGSPTHAALHHGRAPP